jgi:hypothetical protein
MDGIRAMQEQLPREARLLIIKDRSADIFAGRETALQ